MPKITNKDISEFKNAISKYPKYVKSYVKYNDICKQIYLESMSIKSPNFVNTGATIQHNSNNDAKLVKYICDREYYSRIFEAYGKLIDWILNETDKLFQNDPVVGATIWRKYIYYDEYEVIEKQWHLNTGTPLYQRYQAALNKTVKSEDIQKYKSILKEIDEAKKRSKI